MDLREKKTKRSIAAAFLALRAAKPLERITIRELAEKAEISKATFYLHYRDIYALANEMEKQTIQSIMTDIRDPESLVTDPARFTQEMVRAFLLHKEQIDIVFSGARAAVLPDSIEQEIRKRLFALQPEAAQDGRLNILLTYQIQGGYYAYLKNKDRFGTELVSEVLGESARRLRESRQSGAAGTGGR